MLFVDSNYMLEGKMLFLDPSEVRDDTKLDLGSLEYQTVTGLEEMTGADCMISVFDALATSKNLIMVHLQHKALLVQRKHGMDLVHSLDFRLKQSISKMRSTGARQSQCVLLFIGTLSNVRTVKGENAFINGHDTHYPFWSVHEGMSTWNKYGGVIEPPIPRASMFADWYKHKLNHIQDTIDNPVKEFILPPESFYMVEPGDPVQELFVVKDWRRTVLTCPGWGVKRINMLRDQMLADKAADSLVSAIGYMTDDTKVSKLFGGTSLSETARDWLYSESAEQFRKKSSRRAKKARGKE
jgi:hypothetical protein